ncbi:MAG TPA: helix-turn-helix transcriptional regulator [Thermomicrobiales bacterium]|nr:helix-turn-helix transcriptional regulator [Thermomicrobiales bacterium]
MLAEVVRRYRSYDPATGRFDVERGVREYARLINVNAGQLSEILNGKRQPGSRVLRRLAQTFPSAAAEIGKAYAMPTSDGASEPPKVA